MIPYICSDNRGCNDYSEKMSKVRGLFIEDAWAKGPKIWYKWGDHV